MLISVIMPIYNSENFLNRAIQSVLNQSILDFELLLVDDGSKDRSAKIGKEYEKIDRRVKLYQKENGGVSSARNYGLQLAQGEYITFIDSDDAYSPDYLKNLLNAQNRRYDLTVCGISRFIDGKEKKNCLSLELNNKDQINDLILDIFNSGLFNSPVNKLYKSTIIKENKICFNEKSAMGEDYEFNLSYLDCCNNCKFVENSDYYYYIQNQSATYQYRENEFMLRRISIDRTKEYFDKYNIKNNFCDKMKIKLVYSCAMQEIAFNKEKKVYELFTKDDYFKLDRPNSKLMIMFYYCLKTKLSFYSLAFLLYFLKYKVGLKWKGASI